MVLWSYHANFACGPTTPSHIVRDVELEGNDASGGEKDKVQLDDLTNRGPFKCYVTQMGVGVCLIFWKKTLRRCNVQCY